MAQIIKGRTTAGIDGDFVVFLIGLRINRFWAPQHWGPAVMAMPRMLQELYAQPAAQTGFLGHSGLGLTSMVQYWRSFDQLEAYAQDRSLAHHPAWVAFNRRARASRGAVGIWHETYQVRAGGFEAIYVDMPPHGLGKAADRRPIGGADTAARGRLHPRDMG